MGDEGVNSRKRRGEFNSRELARDEIAARRLVAGDLGHNYLNTRGWINCCISHAKLILIHGPLSLFVPDSRRSQTRYFPFPDKVYLCSRNRWQYLEVFASACVSLIINVRNIVEG